MEDSEIALKLTLSIVERIKPTDTATAEAMNASLSLEVAKAYNVILESIQESSKSEDIEVLIGKLDE